MALFIWFREHHPGTPAGSTVVALAQSLDLCPGGSFALRRGLAAFLIAYNDALATREEFDVDMVIHGIVQAVTASQSHQDAVRCSIVDDTGRVTERWLEFADGIGGGRALYSVADLADIIACLKRFMRADAARCDRASAVASPLPQASVRVVYAAPLVSSPAPPALPPDVVTRGEWASAIDAIAAQAAQTAEVLSVLRAHGAVGIPGALPVPTADGSGGARRQHRGSSGPARRGGDRASRDNRASRDDHRASRDSGSDHRASRESGPTTEYRGRGPRTPRGGSDESAGDNDDAPPPMIRRPLPRSPPLVGPGGRTRP